MPGPLMVLTVREAARRGFWAGPLLIVGHGIIELALVISLLLGLSQLMEIVPVSGIIGLSGGTVLIWMGSSTMRKGWQKMPFTLSDKAETGSSRFLVLSGILGSITNPYFLIWWATVGIMYLLMSLKLGFAGIASFFSGHILADLSWYSLVAFFLSTGKRAMNDTIYRWLLLICGVALITLGVYFIIAGLKMLAG